MTKQPANEIDARELALYATNDGDLYRQRAQPIMLNLARKMVRGVYDPALAVTAWRYMADDAAKKYSREFGPCAFSPATRDLAAIEIGESYAEELAEIAAMLKTGKAA